MAVRPLAEKRVGELPAGPLYWRVETFPSLAAAQAAAGPTGLVAESDGRVWLFTLGPRGGASPGDTYAADVGPLPIVSASEYLLRINEASGAPGSVTNVHSHPGSEAFYVLAGEQTIRTSTGVTRVAVGRPEAGPGGGTALQVSSTGASDLLTLVMFVVDASEPFSTAGEFASPATVDDADPPHTRRVYPAGSGYIEPAAQVHLLPNDNSVDLVTVAVHIVPAGPKRRVDAAAPAHGPA